MNTYDKQFKEAAVRLSDKVGVGKRQGSWGYRIIGTFQYTLPRGERPLFHLRISF